MKKKTISPLHVSLLEALTKEKPQDEERWKSESSQRFMELLGELNPASWFDFSFKLMCKFDPVFKESLPRGRERKWTLFRLMILSGEFYRLREHSGYESDANVFAKLASEEPWLSLIQSKSDTLEKTPADALRVARAGAGEPVRRMGVDAYLFHYENDTLEHWQSYLKLILD